MEHQTKKLSKFLQQQQNKFLIVGILVVLVLIGLTLLNWYWLLQLSLVDQELEFIVREEKNFQIDEAFDAPVKPMTDEQHLAALQQLRTIQVQTDDEDELKDTNTEPISHLAQIETLKTGTSTVSLSEESHLSALEDLRNTKVVVSDESIE